MSTAVGVGSIEAKMRKSLKRGNGANKRKRSRLAGRVKNSQDQTE